MSLNSQRPPPSFHPPPSNPPSVAQPPYVPLVSKSPSGPASVTTPSLSVPPSSASSPLGSTAAPPPPPVPSDQKPALSVVEQHSNYTSELRDHPEHASPRSSGLHTPATNLSPTPRSLIYPAPPHPPSSDEQAPRVGSAAGAVGQAAPTTALPLHTSATATVPKVNQSAFIHKLYTMLEDSSIQHLISWTRSNDSFVVTPNEEFSRVLSLYFKHTNVSSFVRQLNMYGFHKVNDVFHSGGSTESGQWEFKHGDNVFRRGDLESLRAIRRRASRQSVAHRDSISSSRSGSMSVPVTPVSPNGMHGAIISNSSGFYMADVPPSTTASSTVTNPPYYPGPTGHRHSMGSIVDYSADSLRLANIENLLWQLHDSHLRLQPRVNLIHDSVQLCQETVQRLLGIVIKMPLGPEQATLEVERKFITPFFGS
ncbi:HSF-type DNA-binding-domain-containing protein [Lipomyces oligophaga]|uniref:HSF-type DNA-binding-domain-containing protein n=1 Tax=Lipomyces oligophaga TaxID=45792 RepID=UPI0034CEE9B1